MIFSRAALFMLSEQNDTLQNDNQQNNIMLRSEWLKNGSIDWLATQWHYSPTLRWMTTGRTPQPNGTLQNVILQDNTEPNNTYQNDYLQNDTHQNAVMAYWQLWLVLYSALSVIMLSTVLLNVVASFLIRNAKMPFIFVVPRFIF